MPLEFGLLHVRVISVITGFVASIFHANRSYRLPPASPYHSCEEEIVATLSDLPANVKRVQKRLDARSLRRHCKARVERSLLGRKPGLGSGFFLIFQLG